jgi:hypothetical protein
MFADLGHFTMKSIQVQSPDFSFFSRRAQEEEEAHRSQVSLSVCCTDDFVPMHHDIMMQELSIGQCL